MELFELGEKATGAVFRVLRRQLNSACHVQTLHLSLKAQQSKKNPKNQQQKTTKPKKPTQKLQYFEHSDEKAVRTLHFQEISPGKPYALLVLQV